MANAIPTNVKVNSEDRKGVRRRGGEAGRRRGRGSGVSEMSAWVLRVAVRRRTAVQGESGRGGGNASGSGRLVLVKVKRR